MKRRTAVKSSEESNLKPIFYKRYILRYSGDIKQMDNENICTLYILGKIRKKLWRDLNYEIRCEQNEIQAEIF